MNRPTKITAKMALQLDVTKQKEKQCTTRKPLYTKADNSLNFHTKKIAKLHQQIKAINDDYGKFRRMHDILVEKHKLLETQLEESKLQNVEMDKNVHRLKFDLLDKQLEVTKEKSLYASQSKHIYELQNTESGLRGLIKDLHAQLAAAKKDTLAKELDDSSAKRNAETLKLANENLKIKYNKEVNHIKYIKSSQLMTERKLNKALLNYQILNNAYIMCKADKAAEEQKVQELILALKQKDIKADIIKKENLKRIEDVKMQLKKVIVDNSHLKSREVIYEQNRKKLAIMESCRTKCQGDMTKLENEFNRLRNRMPAFRVVNYPEHLAYIFENIDDKYLIPPKKINKLLKGNMTMKKINRSLKPEAIPMDGVMEKVKSKAKPKTSSVTFEEIP